jgi:heme exporter protein A
MNRQTALVRCDRVTKRFGRKRVLDNVSLTVSAGEVVALLGANGSGKTTLLRIIAGLERPQQGEVWLGPVPLSAADHEIRRYIGVVAHAPLLYDRLTGAENLRFYARMYDLSEPESRIEQLLRTLDLWRRRDDPVRAYSRGMIQRLAIARAILHDPPVLIFDEPDTGLDRESIARLAELIGQLRQAERALLITTHEWERAFDWADRVCELRGGRVNPLARADRIE